MHQRGRKEIYFCNKLCVIIHRLSSQNLRGREETLPTLTQSATVKVPPQLPGHLNAAAGGGYREYKLEVQKTMLHQKLSEHFCQVCTADPISAVSFW